MSTIALRPARFGQPDTSRLVDCFQVFVCSTDSPNVRSRGEAFTTAAEATEAAEAYFGARVAELSELAGDLFTFDKTARSYAVTGDVAGWGERIEVRVRHAGASDWISI